MILKNITIQNLGTVTRLSAQFSESLNILRDYRREEISYAIRSVFNHKSPPPSEIGIGADTKIKATILLDGNEYELQLSPSEEEKNLRLSCRDAEGRDATKEYLYLTSHCLEQDLSDVFDGDEDGMLLRFLKYANEDLYYSPRELSSATDGLSDVAAFRCYLRSFIENFEPEQLRDGKEYKIILQKNGRYAVKYKIDSVIPKNLSVAERTLFKYLCFLYTAEFWRGFEELRNLHGVKKPLFVSDFLEMLDESIDVGNLLARTERLKRQVIILTSKKY